MAVGERKIAQRIKELAFQSGVPVIENKPLARALIENAAAIGIAIQSIREIITPHHAPEPFTLVVLVLVVITKETTTIVKGKGSEKEIKGRIKQIENEMSLATSSYDKEKLEERKAKLSGGVAVISVGAATESEMKEKKLRVEDAVNATRAAVASFTAFLCFA